MAIRPVSSSKPAVARRAETTPPSTRGARDALRGLALTVRSSEEAAPKEGLEGFLEAAWSRRGAAAALTGISMLGGAVQHVSQNPALQDAAQDLFERTAKPASAWLQEQATGLVERSGLSPLATLLGQRTKAPATVTIQAPEAGSPGEILDAIESGRLTLDVPLKAGEVSVKGVKARIEPGTVLHVQVDVRDGRLVPRSDENGTFATLNKPIDGPLFLTADGVHLADAGGGQGQLKIQLGTDWTDLIDIGVGNQPLQLSQLMARANAGTDATPGGATNDDAALKLADIVDMGAVRFRVDDLSFRDGVLPASGLALKKTGGELSITGDATTLTVSGDIGFDAFDLEREQGSVRFSEGRAHVSVSARKEGAGAVVTTTVSDMEARIERITLPGHGADGTATKSGLDLDDGFVRGGDIRIVARTGNAGDVKAARSVDVHADLQVQGRIADSQLSIADDDGGATLRARSGELTGAVKIRGSEVSVDATLTGADLSLSSLQQQGQGSSIDLENVRVRGDGRLQLGPVHGLSLSLTNAEVNAVISDARSTGANAKTDMGRTTVDGKGDFTWSRAGGLDVRGDLRVKGEIDDLQVRQDGGGSVLDLAPSSTIDGQLRRLSVGGSGFTLDALTTVNLKLERSSLDAGAVKLDGGGSIVGVTNLRIQESARGSRVRLDGDARIDLQLRDGRVRHGDDFDADLGAGTRVRAQLRSLDVGDGVSLTLGEGSRLDAVLDGGHMRIGDKQTSLAAGTQVSFEIDRLSVEKGGEPEIVGKLSLALPFDSEMLKGVPGLELVQQADGLARLTIGGVRMGKDGSFSLSDVGLALEARSGSVSGASRVAAPVPGPISGDVAGVLSRAQVSRTSAADIVGIEQSQTAAFQPLSIARRLQSGTLEVSVPMEGKVKKGAVGVRFEEGTELLLKVQVENGRIVPGELQARLSKPADGPLWVTVKGVRMNDEGTLKLDLSGFFDIAIPGMKRMPTDVDGFIGRIESMASGKSDAGASAASDDAGPSLFRAQEMSFRIQDATLSPGPLALPGGAVNIEAGTRVSLEGNLKEGSVEGQVNFSALQLDEGAFAVRGGSGSARVRTSYQNENGTLRTRTSVDDLRLDAESAAHVGERGDYLQLESGRLAGRVTLEHEVKLDADGRPSEAGKPRVNLELDVQGTIRGARVAARVPGDDARVELGGTTLSGHVSVKGSQLESIAGHVRNLDASLSDLDVKTPAGTLEVDRARVRGDGYVELSSDRMAVLDGRLVADVVVSAKKLGTVKLGGADVDLSRTEIAMRLDLSRLTRVSYGSDDAGGSRLAFDGAFGVGARVSEVSGGVRVP